MVGYDEIFERIPDGVSLHDPSTGSIIAANQQFCDMLGYSRSELLQRDFDAIHADEPPYTADRAREYIRAAAEEGPQTFEWLDERKDGEPILVEVHLRQTTIGGEDRILAVVRDITERRRRQRELERTNERLEEFASVVSHDLRNPLHVAEQRLYLAREECESDHLDDVERALARMRGLIEGVPTLAREGELALEFEAVDLSALVADCWRSLEATLEVETERTIRADADRLRQVIDNLLPNAVEHAGEDVTVRVGDMADGFYVEDTGPGIPEAEREAVFEAGFSRDSAGTGLGLQIVSEIADAHEWTAEVTEGKDDGARFEVRDVEFADG